MASDLKWRTGFGWPAVALLVATSVAVWETDGVARGITGTVCTLVLVYLAYQWQKWNKRGWHQVHFRAMLLYARLAGIETARAQQEGNSFNKVDACRALALAMTGPGREAGIDVMINSLVEERGSYFAGILERYGAQAAPKLTPETIRSIAE